MSLTMGTNTRILESKVKFTLRRLLSFLIVSFAMLGMRSRRVRKFVQGSLARILSNDRHKSFLIKKIHRWLWSVLWALMLTGW